MLQVSSGGAFLKNQQGPCAGEIIRIDLMRRVFRSAMLGSYSGYEKSILKLIFAYNFSE